VHPRAIQRVERPRLHPVHACGVWVPPVPCGAACPQRRRPRSPARPRPHHASPKKSAPFDLLFEGALRSRRAGLPVIWTGHSQGWSKTAYKRMRVLLSRGACCPPPPRLWGRGGGSGAGCGTSSRRASGADRTQV
jgi:hypothetical protein